MGILNYSTKIPASKTVAELQSYLGSHGAQHVSTEYAAGKPVAVRFAAKLGAQLVWFRMPSDPQGVLQAMDNDSSVPDHYCTEQQAERVAWRIVKNWCEAQFALIEARQATLAQVFLPYALVDQDTTLYEQIADRGLQQLPGGE
jgi:hypothetical protein